VEAQITKARELAAFDDVVAVSARDGFNVDGFVEALVRLLPTGPRYFPRDMETDQPLEVMISEFVREKILRATREEVPHAVGVVVEDVAYDAERGMATVHAIVFVERESQRGIIVGKGGEMIKRIGTEARVDLERLLGSRVYLDLVVRVRKNWRRDAAQIRRFGYGEGL
jgi:GTP-binding protein Era